MTGKTTVSSLSDRLSSLSDDTPTEKVALLGILCLSAFLDWYQISKEGYANLYYAAAVKNMLTSWHNFFFVSFDAGFVTVDKPPLGLWIQTASAWLFGFHGWSLILPQVIACLLSVALLYHIVGRTFDSRAGLAAALTMALTAVVIPTSRNNTADMLVVLGVLGGAYFVLRAAETGRRRWLFAAAAAVGLGFNIKMMEAYLVLPAFYLVYLLGAKVSIRRRITDLVLSTGVLFVVSFAWATVVTLTPASQRPGIRPTVRRLPPSSWVASSSSRRRSCSGAFAGQTTVAGGRRWEPQRYSGSSSSSSRRRFGVRCPSRREPTSPYPRPVRPPAFSVEPACRVEWVTVRLRPDLKEQPSSTTAPPQTVVDSVNRRTPPGSPVAADHPVRGPVV